VPGKPSKLSIPSATKETLSNGLKLIIGRQRPTGITNINVVIGTGSLADKDGLSGTASLVSELLVRGTVSRDAPSIAAEAESLGGTLSTSITHEAIRIGISVPSTRAGLALELLADLTQRSTFPEVELDKKRTELLDNLKVELGRPGTLARLAINRSIYGKQGYGRPVGGTLKSLTRIRQRDLKAFHATYFTGRNTTLVLTGDVPSSIKGDLSAARWLDMADVSIPVSTPKSNVEKPIILLIDKRDAGQAAVMAAAPGVGRSDKRWPILMLANSILGGGYSARLNKEIRIQRGLAYGAFSGISERKGAGVITLSAQTRLDAAATVAEILVAQLDRMMKQPVPSDELSIRRSALTGPLSRDLATASGYADGLITQTQFGLPVDQTGIAATLEAIRKAESSDVQRVMQSVFGTRKPTVVVVGDARVCLADLKKHFKTVKVVSEASWLQGMDTWS
jgi:zinc protease